jgi:hypothetical protein
MGAKIFLDGNKKFLPQMDFAVQQTDNGGIEATQSFLCRSTSLGTADLTPFRRGTRAEVLWPEVPYIYRGLTVKTAIPNQSNASGMWEVKVVFTGVMFAWTTGGGSSGSEQTTPTYSLQGNLEEAPINEHPKWRALDEDSQLLLGRLLDGSAQAKFGFTQAGGIDPTDGAWKFVQGSSGTITLSGDAVTFAKMIAEGRTTYKRPSWTYTIREESSRGFTSAQLNDLGKITNPPGTPPKPSSSWTWMLTGPSQEQSGVDRFFKDTTYLLVENSKENQFLYDS